MTINQYYSFAIGGGVGSPNTLTNSAYVALTALRANGFVPGVALSEQVNTVLRQATTAASGVAQFAANNQGTDVLDDGSAANFAARVQAAVDARIALLAVPPGLVMADTGLSLPAGWLYCDGTLYLNSAFPALAARIGTTYGGDSTHFRVPDLRGEFIRGLDRLRGIDVGRLLGSAQGDAIRNITGTFDIDDSQTTHMTGAFATGTGIGNGVQQTGSGFLGTFDASRVVPTATENRPRNVALNYVIKT